MGPERQSPCKNCIRSGKECVFKERPTGRTPRRLEPSQLSEVSSSMPSARPSGSKVLSVSSPSMIGDGRDNVTATAQLAYDPGTSYKENLKCVYLYANPFVQTGVLGTICEPGALLTCTPISRTSQMRRRVTCSQAQTYHHSGIRLNITIL